MREQEGAWSEDDSEVYRSLASVAVPARREQLAALASLIPWGSEEELLAVDLGCGEGALSATVLGCFPNSRIRALDGSASMRRKAQEVLAAFDDRAEVDAFDLETSGWLSKLDGADCVVSSLCLHHIGGPEKRRLFGEIAGRLSERGTLLIADLVEPQLPAATSLFAATWDLAAREQSIATSGTDDLFQRFQRFDWNHFRFPDAGDTPSPLAHQLRWLEEAGFAIADCFWFRAGHAIYGGYKSPGTTSSLPGFERATEAAGRALELLR